MASVFLCTVFGFHGISSLNSIKIEPGIHSLIHSNIPPVFVEYLLYARHWGYSNE